MFTVTGDRDRLWGIQYHCEIHHVLARAKAIWRVEVLLYPVVGAYDTFEHGLVPYHSNCTAIGRSHRGSRLPVFERVDKGGEDRLDGNVRSCLLGGIQIGLRVRVLLWPQIANVVGFGSVILGTVSVQQ